VDAIIPVHKAQLLSYLRLSNKRIGLLINFNSVHLKDGIKRIVNNL
jgi:GxxExxY protein